MSAKDDYAIALNILSRVGMDGDLIGEFGKAKALLHGLDAQSQMTPPQINPVQGQNGPLEPQMTSNPTQGEIGAENGLQGM